MGQRRPIRLSRAAQQPPMIAEGRGEPDDAWLIEDTLQKLRIIHEIPLRGLSGIYEALVPEGPSVWEATGKSKDRR